MPKVNDIVYLRNSHDWIAMLRSFAGVLTENIDFADKCEALFEDGQHKIVARVARVNYGEGFDCDSHYSIIIDLGDGPEEVDVEGSDLEPADLERDDAAPALPMPVVSEVEVIRQVLYAADATSSVQSPVFQREPWIRATAERIANALSDEVVQ